MIGTADDRRRLDDREREQIADRHALLVRIEQIEHRLSCFAREKELAEMPDIDTLFIELYQDLRNLHKAIRPEGT